MQSNLDYVREKVIEAVPSILELKFGCEVDRGAGRTNREFVCGFFNDEISIVRRTVIGDFLPFFVPKNLVPTWKIIGRKIGLCDVLIAFNYATMRRFPRFHGKENELINLLQHEQVMWNLRHDDLSLQSPETLEFLAILLGKK